MTIGLFGAREHWGYTVDFVRAAVYTQDEDSNRYRQERTSVGTEICRDTETGQFAESENCEDDLKVGLSAAAALAANLGSARTPVMIGAGYSVGEPSGAFASFMFSPAPAESSSSSFYFNAKLGESFGVLSVGVAYRP